MKFFLLILTTFCFSSVFASESEYPESDQKDEFKYYCMDFLTEFAGEAKVALSKSKVLSGNFNNFKPYPDNKPQCEIGVTETNSGDTCAATCKFTNGEGEEVIIKLEEANWRQGKNKSKNIYDVMSVEYISTL